VQQLTQLLTPAASKAAWMVCGRREPGSRLASPSALKAWMTLRTHWSLQPRLSAIWRAVWRRALASRIWQRRRTADRGVRRAQTVLDRPALVLREAPDKDRS
jgi:hypothetical protein